MRSIRLGVNVLHRRLAWLFLILTTTAAAAPRSLVVVTPRSPWTLREIEALQLDLVSYDPETGAIYLTVTSDEERALVERGFAVATVEPDADAARQRLLDVPGLGLYHTYDETVAALESLQAAHPTRARLEMIGASLEGRPIHALKISDTPEVEDPTEPDVLFVGNHHAREFMSVEVPLSVARTLLERYASSPRIRQLVDTREIWIVPLLNPDGHVYQSESQMRPGWRKNRRVIEGEPIGVDLNRNYSYQWAYDNEGSSGDPLSETYRGAAPFSEAETDVLRQLVERQEFTVAVSFHSFGRLVLFPWGHTRDTVTQDHAVFVAMADSMVRDNGYRPGNAYTGAIYLTNGVWDDYMYGDVNSAKPQRTFAFTVELNDASEGGFWPPEDLIEPTCAAMWPLALYVLRVADDVRRTLPPPPPVLSAVQDGAEPRRIHLAWTGARADAPPIDHYEVFEIAATQDPHVLAAARPVRVAPGERDVLVRGVHVPADGALPLMLCGQLDPLWERLRVEARLSGDAHWQAVPLVAASAARGSSATAGEAPRLAGPAPRRVRAAAAAWGGRRVDLAIGLEAGADAPHHPWVEARLDVSALLAETRRVLAVVHDTTYTVEAERAGLFAYGVTAVDDEGQGADSDIFWFAIPAGVPVALHDLEFTRAAADAVLRGRVETSTPATFEAWVHRLDPGEMLGSAAAEWQRGRSERVASVTATASGAWSLRFRLAAGRNVVLLRTADGMRMWGPWEASVLPRLALRGAVPNPFNPVTRLHFESDGLGAVTLEILRPDGKRVRCLLAGATLAPGPHDATWDGRDDAGRRVAAGVYLALLQAHGEKHATRLVLLP